eukprot:jgi/Mesen1/5657/ME000286S04868
MGCVQSTPKVTTPVVKDASTAGKSVPVAAAAVAHKEFGPFGQFREFTLDEVRKATQNFSDDIIVSEGGKGAPNVVYKAEMPDGRPIAVKRFQSQEWPNSEHFIREARKVGKVRHPGVVDLIGFCCNGQERMLVSDFMPGFTLTHRLFHWDKQPMPFSQRLHLATKLAEALEYLESVPGLPLLFDVNGYRIMFDSKDQPKLSTFGLVKSFKEGESLTTGLTHAPPELLQGGVGRATTESVVYSYGIILLALLSGKSIRPNQFLDLVRGKSNLMLLVDSNLLGRPGMEQAMELVPLVADCLQQAPEHRPSLKSTLRFLAVLEARTRGIDLPFNEEEETQEEEEEEEVGPPKLDMAQLTPFARAAATGNFLALHELLVRETYGTPPQEVSFESWNLEMQELLDARKKGDHAFKHKRWENAVEKYTQFTKLGSTPMPLMFARRCVANLNMEHWQAALADAMQAAQAHTRWPEAYYLQAAALAKLGMTSDASEMLAEGARLEPERSPRSPNRRSPVRSPVRSPGRMR